MKGFSLKPNQKLLNGATIIAVREILHKFFVLCVKDNGEYVTWVSDKEGNTYHGRYFTSDLQKAVNSFYNR